MKRLPTPYQEFIHLSRYSRWLDDKKRRETWSETVARYFDFFTEHLREKCGYEMEPSVRKELEDAVLDLKVMPSMRCLMTAGEALKRDHVAGYNPVSGDTLVLTKEHGNVPIKNLSGSTATVLNLDGRWTEAVFRSYGSQAISKVAMRLNSNTVREVECTPNHRWILKNGTVKSTAELVAGDQIPFASAPKPPIDEDYRLGVIHGIVYGDGTATRTQKRVKGYHIRLCGDSRELLPWFEGYPVAHPPSYNGDPVVMMYDGFASTHELKELPCAAETDSYLLGFIRGWIAADGSVSESSQVTICVDKNGADWLDLHSERIGFVVQSKYKMQSETNYGLRRKDSYKVSFSRSSIVADDLLCSWKRKNFRELKSHFVVKEIVPLPEKKEVFCAEVPDTNTFVLSMGLVTGNCSYAAIKKPIAFDEIMYILMCGTGAGFSPESRYAERLPVVASEFHDTDTVIVVRDSKIGWCKAFKELISLLYTGHIPKWDVSKVRPAGARLKTFGGRASGPQPLVNLFEFCCRLFPKAAGRRLTPIEVHDIVCYIAKIVVVGGVRRSALISLSDLTDALMREAKTGDWYGGGNPQRALANNSAVYESRPPIGVFMDEWKSLYDSKSGERGIFNREAARNVVRRNGRRDPNHEWGTNPCSEIILRDCEFCNLSEAILRYEDNTDDIADKVRLATILGTWQSTLTDFRYLSAEWKRNCEEERLLGVSLTGIQDHPTMNQTYDIVGQMLSEYRQIAIDTNAEWAAKLKINPSAAITCVKPSGTVSQLVDCSSGIHTRWSPYYIRRVQASKLDPMTRFMIDRGFPHEQSVYGTDQVCFSFPIKAPPSSPSRNDLTAIEQLELWMMYQKNWCEHKPSCTVYIREHEWLQVGSWVYDHFDDISGIAFLPHSDHNYSQPPYTDCTKEEYESLVAKMPQVDWAEMSKYENEDNTIGSQTMACTGETCEVVDLT